MLKYYYESFVQLIVTSMTNDNDPDTVPSDQRKDTRPSPIAGLWYSASPKQLSREIDAYLNVEVSQANLPASGSKMIGLVAPHAGYRYSGRTAGYAFSTVKGANIDLVVVISPLHAYHHAPILTSTHAAYATPFGEVPIDQAALLKLEQGLKERHIHLARIAHDGEHSLEIELPFLQRALSGSFHLLPLMVRSLDDGLLKQAAQILVEVIHDRNVLMVASTDLSHFYPLSSAEKLDTQMLHQIVSLSPEGVLEAERSGTGFACGAGAVAMVLWASKLLGGDSAVLLHHSTSADETGDRSSVVGYGAAAIYKHT